MAPKQLYLRLNLKLGEPGDLLFCVNTSHPAFGGSRKSELLMEAVERFLNVLELWSTVKTGIWNRKLPASVQDTTEPVFSLKGSLKNCCSCLKGTWEV